MDKNNLDFDNKVKEKLKEEVNNIPDNINKAFDNAIEKVTLKNRKNNKKKITKIAAIFIASGIVLGVSVSPYAKDIPILRNIYETFKSKSYENYDKYADDINITKKSNGISITINKVIYDGLDLEVFYTIESEKPMVERFPYFENHKVKINGEEIGIGNAGRGDFSGDKKVYIGSIKYPVSSQELMPEDIKEEFKIKDIPDEFMLTLEINKISFANEKKIKGNWNFDIPVSRSKMIEDSKEIEINCDLGEVQENLKVEKLILTPINTSIQGSSSYEGRNNFLEFMMIDDLGRILIQKGNESARYQKESEFGQYFNYTFKELYEDTKSVTLVPYITAVSNPSFDDSEGNNPEATKEIIGEPATLMTVPLNLEGETKLKTKYEEDYGTITKVEILEDKTDIYFKPTRGHFSIFDEIKDMDNNRGFYPIKNRVGEEESASRYIPETGEFVIEFTRPLTGDNLTVSYYDYSRTSVYFFDKAITVDIN